MGGIAWCALTWRQNNEPALLKLQQPLTNNSGSRTKTTCATTPFLITYPVNGYVYPQLKSEPFWGANIKKHQGYTPETWRYRIGKFRLFYVADQDERILYILSVDDRKDAYR